MKKTALALAAAIAAGLAPAAVLAAPITDFAHFNTVPNTVISFEQDGAGNTLLNPPNNYTFPSTEYAAQGVTINPDVRLARDNDSCFRTVQSFNGSLPFGLIASQTSSIEFNPPTTAFAVSFVAIQFQFATFTALDEDNNVIETATFAPPFVDGFGCGFLEYGVIGIASATPIHRVNIAAPSGSIDRRPFALPGDSDGDGVLDENDNCVSDPNPGQEDADGDGLGDACDACPNDADNDADGDGICGDVDNCPAAANVDQTNTDGDGQGDACDPDDDNDGVPDGEDEAPLNQFACRDSDADGCDDCSSGVENAASDGLDTDGDGACDAGDPDDDNDTVLDGADADPYNAFVCGDSDGDGCDDCSVTGGPPSTTNDGPDFDNDGFCDAGDLDDDMDGVTDDMDNDPFDPFVCRDADADGCDDCGILGSPDPSIDGLDFDADGLCDDGDPDDDNDGLSDVDETTYGTDPFDGDTDNDGLLDGTEVDMAMGGGCPNPLTADSDGDTISDGDETAGNTDPCSTDTDNDGVPDNVDPLPTQPGVTQDFLEDWVRELATDTIPSLDLSLFTGPNNNAKRGRRNSFTVRAAIAANAIANGNYLVAIVALETIYVQVNNQGPIPDWMHPSPQQAALADEIEQLIDLLILMF